MIRFKGYLLGIATGLIIAGGVSYADEGLYQLSKMEASIWANGQRISMLDTPILNYNGSSYVPLRKISEVTGANVVWDASTQSINLTSSTKEVIKEVPKEVVKEVPLQVKGKYGVVNVKYDADKDCYMLVDTDVNGNGQGFSFNLDGCFAGIFLNNTIKSSYHFVLDNNNTSVQQNNNDSDDTKTQKPNMDSYNTELNKITSNYNYSLTMLKNDYEQLRRNASDQYATNLKVLNQKIASMAIHGRDSEIAKNKVESDYQNQITQLNNQQKIEEDKLKDDFDEDVLYLKAKYNIKE